MKAHAVVSSDSLPLAIFVVEGNEHDSRRFDQVVSSVRIIMGRGRPKPDQKRFWPMQLTILNPYGAILEEEVFKAAFRLTSATRRKYPEGGQLDLTTSHIRSEEPLSDFLVGSNSDLGEFPCGMKDSMYVSQA